MNRNRHISFIVIMMAAISLLAAACSSARGKARTVPPAAKAGVAGQDAKAPAGTEPEPAKAPGKTAGALPDLGKDDLAELQENGKNGQPVAEGAAAYLEEALQTYQDAQAALDKGETEAAMAKLDEAYGLILKAETPPDSDLCQEKNDLRILIAQRIQQLYAAHLKTPAAGNGTIPLVENRWVEAEIRSFQTRERAYFLDAYKRSGLYRPMIVEELKRAGLPEQLSWVPIIESGFKPRALSAARALGMWQFIRSTGYRFGLKQDKYIDERMDPLKATRAAIQFLTVLHEFFGDWTTALASYNCGEFRVQNVIKAQKIDYLDNFWDLFNNLPYETARFVPRIIAVMLIVENPGKYGFTLPTPDAPVAFETVRVDQPVKLAALASSLGLDPVLLSFLNSELRHDSTPNYAYDLKVPAGYGERIMAALPALPRYIPPEAVYGWHSVRSGDTLGALARRYRTTTQAIMRLNNIKNPRTLRVGQKLKIPGKGDPREPEPGAGASAAAATGSGAAYTVKAGDTLYTLARVFNTTVDRIKSQNSLATDSLTVGQKLVI